MQTNTFKPQTEWQYKADDELAWEQELERHNGKNNVLGSLIAMITYCGGSFVFMPSSANVPLQVWVSLFIPVGVLSVFILLHLAKVKINVHLWSYATILSLGMSVALVGFTINSLQFSTKFAYIPVFITFSLVAIWPLRHTITTVIVIIAFDYITSSATDGFSTRKWLNFWSLLLPIAIGGVLLIYYKYTLFKKNFMVTRSLNRSNQIIQQNQEELQKKNHDITSSINYASRIQTAMLPSNSYVERIFPESFVFYRPRDIVSGDFYWLWENDGKTWVAAVDCTGHGVPGALMSMIGNSLLDQIIQVQGIEEPAQILRELSKGINTALNQKESDSQDGMDMSLCLYDRKQRTLTYAGAKNPLVYVQNGELKVIKGTRSSIGGEWGFKDGTFEQHTLSPDNGELTFYLFSDGFQDQFGGIQGKKMGTKAFQELLFSVSHEKMFAQRAILEAKFKNWLGTEHKQIDDVMVLGIRLR